MKRLFLLMVSFLLVGFIYAQTAAFDTAKVKVYVGVNAGADTMTVSDFLKFGKVETNSIGWQVRSFTLGITGIGCNGCEMATAHFHNNVFNTTWAAKAIKDMNVKMVEVSISEIKLIDASGKEVGLNFDKQFSQFIKTEQ